MDARVGVDGENASRSSGGEDGSLFPGGDQNLFEFLLDMAKRYIDVRIDPCEKLCIPIPGFMDDIGRRRSRWQRSRREAVMQYILEPSSMESLEKNNRTEEAQTGFCQ